MALQATNNVAPLRNVSALLTLTERINDRHYGEPGMAVFYGHSGYGKSSSVTFARIEFQAIAVEVRSTWTQRDFCVAVLKEMGLHPQGGLTRMIDMASEYLAKNNVPLLIDEADYLVQKRKIELVRDIHTASDATVILIGEEALPQKLTRWERIHGRMLDWVRAEPADESDVHHLAQLYCHGLDLSKELLDRVRIACGGNTRRIVINFGLLREHCQTHGLTSLDLKDRNNRGFFTGEAPNMDRRGMVA